MYENGTYITDPIGNNEFSYQERIALGSIGKIFVPRLKQGTVDDLEVGSEIVFEEVEPTKSRNSGVKNNKLISCTGLKHFIQTKYKGIPVYIIDNHNHALTFWYKLKIKLSSFIGKEEACPLRSQRVSADADGRFKEHLVVIHIDQHTDIKPNTEGIHNDIETFVNEKTNVGNFISAALNNKIINDVIQIRTDYALQHFNISTFQHFNIIVDIDIDFRADKEITPEDIETIRKVIKKAKLVTIATSPYFIDQKRAIEIINKILA